MVQDQVFDFIRYKLKEQKDSDVRMTGTMLSEKCLEFMYKKNDPLKPFHRKELISYMDGLEDMCKQCGKKRAESDNDLSIIENSFIEFIRKKYHLNIIKWKPNKAEYPEYMLLNTDKGILAYINIFYHDYPECLQEEQYCYRNGICYEFENLVKRISLAQADLDRPVFYVHVLDYPCLKGIFFETSEQIKDCILRGNKRVIMKDNKYFYYTDLLEMGLFEELMTIFSKLKKYNVQLN